MIRSIRLQLTLWYIGSISLLIFVFGSIAFFSLRTILVKNLDQALYNGAKILERSLTDYTLEDENDPQSLHEVGEEDALFADLIDEEVDESFFVSMTYAQLAVFPAEEHNGPPRIIARTTTLEAKTLPFSQHTDYALRNNSLVFETTTGLFPFALRMISLHVRDQDERPYILQVAQSLHEMHTTLRDLLLILAILFPVLLVTLSVLGYIFMKRVFSPVKKMVAVTKSITAEDLSLRLEPLESHDEIGELAETLNAMIARLERSFQQIQQFSGDVSHELKTPLAELKCNAEVALRRERMPQDYQEVLRNIIEDTEKLRQIVEDLLLLARMDARSLPLVFLPVALNELFFEVFERMHPLAQKKNLAINFAEIAPVTIPGDTGLIKQLLTNLIGNAIRYTPSGREITFAVYNDGVQAVVSVSDTGIGIPKEALPYIFDRFYRVEQSRSHETGGSGLGLAIAQKIAELHGGRIVVQSIVKQGTTFRVLLPCQS
jgi:heavy metal sensor kinase